MQDIQKDVQINGGAPQADAAPLPDKLYAVKELFMYVIVDNKGNEVPLQVAPTAAQPPQLMVYPNKKIATQKHIVDIAQKIATSSKCKVKLVHLKRKEVIKEFSCLLMPNTQSLIVPKN